MKKSYLALAVATTLTLTALSAHAITANPLMRPAPAPAAQSPSGLPPMPPTDGMFGGGPGMGQPTGPGGDKTDERIKAAQNALVRYNVVAISGDTAVLRITAAPGNIVPTQSGSGNSTSSVSGAAADFYGVLPSMVVTDGEELVVQDVKVKARVKKGQVTLLTADGQRSIYAGRLDGNMNRNYRGFNWVTPDAAYTTRQSPPLSKTVEQPSNTSNGTTNNNGSTNAN